MIHTSTAFRWLSLLAITVAVVATVGCSNGMMLASAPNLYIDSTDNPYESVPVELQGNTAEVVYATDREPRTVDGVYGYGVKRSRIISFGLCTVQMGKASTTWEQVVRASRTRDGGEPLALALRGVNEHGRWPSLGPSVEIDGEWVDNPEDVKTRAQKTQQLHTLLAERLALTPRKELFVFVHGYNNTFEVGAFRAAQIWHFTGRAGVPVLFSWPAGSSGVLKGYTRDRESGEFANPHLKNFLRDLASCPDVRKIHLIAHSRGTDILATAVRELHLECRGAGKRTRDELKLGQIVLAAPDIDLDVFIERFSADRVGFVAERLTVYVSPGDKAIGLSGWLFGSTRRIGQLAMGDLGSDFAVAAKKHPIMNFVDVRAQTDRRGHGYFLSSPAALSDLILVLRDHRAPGAANGRPLFDDPEGFWELRDGYPSIVHDPPP